MHCSCRLLPPQVCVLQLLEHAVAQLDAKGMQQRSGLLEGLKHGVCPVAALAHVTHARQDVVQRTGLLLCLLAFAFTCKQACQNMVGQKVGAS